MGWAFWALAGVLLAVAALAITLAVRLRGERLRTRRDLDALLAERDELRARIAELTREVQALQRTDRPDYVITRVGGAELDAVKGGVGTGHRIPDQVVLSTAFGEPLVKVLSFGYGVRRALSPESRNRIGFEMRREVRRTRKARRREMREAWKQMRAQRATDQTADGGEDVA